MSKAKDPDSSFPPISATLQKLYKTLKGFGEIPSATVLLRLQEVHSEYGKGAWPNLHEVRTLDQRTIEHWIRSAEGYFQLGEGDVIDGRKLVVAIALEDPLIAPFLSKNGFLKNLEDEFTPPLKGILHGDAYDRFSEIARNIPTANEKSDQDTKSSAETGDSRLAEHAHQLPDHVPTRGDHPAHEDQLGRRAFARALSHRLIRAKTEDNWQQTSTPWALASLWFAWKRSIRFLQWLFIRQHPKQANHNGAFMMHIHGPWGSGKSSLLNFIRQELHSQPGDDRWVSIYFNAWRYQRLRPPWWALTHGLYRQARAELQKANLPNDQRRATVLLLNEMWWRILHGWGGSILLVGLVVLGFAWLLGISEVEFLKQSADFTKNAGALVAFLGGTLSAVRFLITGSARGSDAFLEIMGDPMGPMIKRCDQIIRYVGRPVVVIIDDLDRCDGDYVIQLLHGIQTMYWETQAAYVVAADRDWLRAAKTTTRPIQTTWGNQGAPSDFFL